MFLHRFEQRGLGLGRRAVDFVRENHVREDRAFDEDHLAAAGRVLLENLRAGDVGGHEVRRELDALELEVEDLRERLDEERLGEAGRAGDEAVAAGEERDEELLDDFALADDDLAQLGADARAAGDELFDGLLVGGGGVGWCFHSVP